jgi:polyphosphate glucokinase
MNVLVIDIGGSHVKLYATDHPEPRKFDSGPGLTPGRLASEVRRMTTDWTYDAASIGYPGRVSATGPVDEPGNLGDGWVGFDFERALGVPVRLVHDAVLQALGGYQDGRMLFLGFGTGLGSALVVNRVAISLDLGDLVHPSGDLLSDRLGKRGLEKHGHAAWQREALATTAMLRQALAADHVLLGGGNAARIDAPLPDYVRCGGNDDAFTGGLRLWEDLVEHHDTRPSPAWRVV